MFREPNHLCLVYEYAKYGCLADMLRRIPNSFTWSLKIRTAYQVFFQYILKQDIVLFY